MSVGPFSYAGLILLCILFNLVPIFQYWSNLKIGYQLLRNRGDKNSMSDDFVIGSDVVAKLRLIEGYLEASSQLMFQVFLIFKQDNFSLNSTTGQYLYKMFETQITSPFHSVTYYYFYLFIFRMASNCFNNNISDWTRNNKFNTFS